MTSDAPAAFVVALSDLGRLAESVFSSLVALGFKFLMEVSFSGAQSSALPSIFVFTSRFAFLVSRRTVLVPGFLCSCPSFGMFLDGGMVSGRWLPGSSFSSVLVSWFASRNLLFAVWRSPGS